MGTLSSVELRPVIRAVTEEPVRVTDIPTTVGAELCPEARSVKEEEQSPSSSEPVILAVEDLVPIIRDAREG